MPLKGLKRFRLRDIEPGMILGKTVLDEFGRVIVEQGKVILQEGAILTRELLDRLLNWNIQVVDVQVLLPTAKEAAQTVAAERRPAQELLDWINERDSLSANLDRLAQALGKKYPSDNVFVSLQEGDPVRWWTLGAAGSFRLPDASVEQKFKGQDYLAGKTVVIGELSMEKNPPTVLARADMMSMCGAPIIVDGVTVGAVEVFSRNAGAFASSDADRLETCARLAGVVFMHAKTREELRQAAEERDLLYDIVGSVAADMTVDQLLMKVTDTLGNYFSAHAVAAFIVQRLPHLNKANAVLARNFNRNDLETMKELFAKRWPVTGTESSDEGSIRWKAEAQRHFTTKLSAGKTSYVLPLFSRDLLQGILVLQWDYDRRSDFHSHMDDTLRIVAAQTALGIERQHLYSGVEKIGLTDALTGLSNRRLFNYLIEREINRSRRYGRPVSLIMLDIDFFKRINDTWGHPVGDAVLRELGALVRQSVRKLDVPVRFGGEEFAIILPETTLEEAVNLAERFRVTVERAPFSSGRDRIPVTISLGVASIGNGSMPENMDAEDFLQMADKALYQAKQSGRNRIAVGRAP